jgi:hypothetical protein
MESLPFPPPPAEKAVAHLQESRKELLSLLRNEPWLWQRPTATAWSAAEIAEHLARTEDSVARVLRRLRREAAGEQLPPVPFSPGVFHEGKPQAPPSVQPRGGIPYKELQGLLQETREKLLQEIALFDFEYPGTFPHPFYSAITGLQWVWMAALHERHHLKQIYDRLKNR